MYGAPVYSSSVGAYATNHYVPANIVSNYHQIESPRAVTPVLQVSSPTATYRSLALPASPSSAPIVSVASNELHHDHKLVDDPSLHTGDENRAGVGIIFVEGLDRGKIPIMTFVRGGAAEKDGNLKVGDCIVEVDGYGVEGEPLHVIRQLILGPAGTTVTMGFRRQGTDGVIRVRLTRQRRDEESGDEEKLNRETQRFQKEKQELQRRIAQLESERSRDRSNHELEFDKLKDELASLTDRLSRTERDLQDERRHGQQLQSELRSAQQYRRDAEGLQQQLDVSSEKLRQEQALRQRLEDEVRKTEIDLDRIRASVDTRERSEAEMERMRGEIDRLRNQIHASNEQVERLRNQLLSANEQASVAEFNRESMHRELLEERSLRSQIQRVADESTNRTQQRQALEAEVSELRRIIQQRDEQIHTLRDGMNEVHRRAEMLEASLQQERSQRSADGSKLEEVRREERRRYDEEIKRIQSARQSDGNAEEQIRMMQFTLETSERNRKELSDRNRRSEEEIDRLRHELAVMQNERVVVSERQEVHGNAGVGLILDDDPDKQAFPVRMLVRDSAAFQAGCIQEGDYVIAVDGTPVAGKALSIVKDVIKGPVGTQVKLTFARGSPGPFEADRYTVALTRGKELHVSKITETLDTRRGLAVSTSHLDACPPDCETTPATTSRVLTGRQLSQSHSSIQTSSVIGTSSLVSSTIQHESFIPFPSSANSSTTEAFPLVSNGPVSYYRPHTPTPQSATLRSATAITSPQNLPLSSSSSHNNNLFAM